jgi:hypothetical protein
LIATPDKFEAVRYQPDAPVLMLRCFEITSGGIDIGENGETPHNDRIIGFSPAGEGAAPWSWSPM